MKQFYVNQWKDFKVKSFKFFIVSLVLIFSLNLIAYFGVINNPGSMAEMKKSIIDSLGGMEKLETAMKDNHTSLFYLLKNNVSLSLLLMAVGFLPLYLASFIVFLPNTILLGTVLGIDKIETGSALSRVFTTIAPHGVTEFLSIILTASLSFQLSHTVTRKIFSKRRNEISLIDSVGQIAQFFLTIALPLMILSAFIETFITPLMIKHFL